MSDVVRVFGNAYRYQREEPYRKKNGDVTALGVWQSDCAECGQPFVVKLPVGLTPRSRPVNRRCAKHVQAGKPTTKAAARSMARNIRREKSRR